MTTINNSQLIEKVGGIEKAREIAFDPLHQQMTHVSNDGRHWINEAFAHIHEIQCQIESMIRINDLRTAIAEYDVAIVDGGAKFKVGDLVVFTDIQNSCIVTFEGKELTPIEMYSISYPDGTTGQIYSLSKIRHATPEEIKAGHRLEAERHG